MRWVCGVCLLLSMALGADPAYSDARARQEASIERQRASVSAQQAALAAGNPAFFAPPMLPETAFVPQVACERIPLDKVRDIVDEGARKTGLDPGLVRAVVRKESAYDTCATSVKGAQGLMQLMPSVQTQFGVTNPYDPGQNVEAGTRLLKQLLTQYGGDLAKALGAYNAGPGQVEKWGGLPQIPETRKYVVDILGGLN
ncbi:MAG TPA: lytic transglycosylase domain-containing protein [Bryobacteraceae bacterium]|nr:lytic transglycosylase domain-containing protein [Bryobacteraceae bacterium]